MELSKTHYYKRMLLVVTLMFYYACNLDDKLSKLKEINRKRDSVKNSVKSSYEPYIDFINDTGFYKNHTSIIIVYPYGPYAMQVFDTTKAREMAITNFKGELYSIIFQRIEMLGISKKEYLLKHNVDTFYTNHYYTANESIYLTGNNTVGGSAFLFSDNFGHAEPDNVLFNLYYSRDTIFVSTYADQKQNLPTEKDVLNTDKIYFPLKKLLALKF